MTPQLTLVGAGPGDGELITLKGVKALKCADVVLYDALVNPELLAYCPAHTFKMYTGKRAGRHSFQQHEINSLIVRLARKRGHVVRLKGGDPFVFGRGHEEINYAQQHGIACEIIPGISSCTAVPALHGIPVTRRGVSESFWVLTGTTQEGKLTDDLYLAARSNATVVILMGLKKIQEICSLYHTLGRGEIPMAVIQNGSRAHENCVIGCANEMPELLKSRSIGAVGAAGPAVIVVGDVVALHPDYVLDYVQRGSVTA
ncbi:uroporphyrinogen-III C-methyltransferase [Arundinibacter roseus]|uniref:uroporphyrinogen-III C-methyltransferase n=1 Tax=Arundinibacter roseus TaxID=2070510 RepID=A0A4R4K450_9BACT|nr:uroporphyrinogen-III C-methyltransferase [Arundinibacter roseus]TDB61392.1 uroporphyrinogen-III C-methyltransferase [Arundinibacter roseus]